VICAAAILTTFASASWRVGSLRGPLWITATIIVAGSILSFIWHGGRIFNTRLTVGVAVASLASLLVAVIALFR
jgi:hypothetical protein